MWGRGHSEEVAAPQHPSLFVLVRLWVSVSFIGRAQSDGTTTTTTHKHTRMA